MVDSLPSSTSASSRSHSASGSASATSGSSSSSETHDRADDDVAVDERARNASVEHWLGLGSRQDTGREHHPDETPRNREKKTLRRCLVVDSRDRDLDAYPSANRFDVFLGEQVRGATSIELVSAVIPLVDGFDQRYVVLAEDHCEMGLMATNRVPFGVDTTVAASAASRRAGCAFPSGSIAAVPTLPRVADAGGSYAAVWETSGAKASRWKARLRKDVTRIERLSFSIWCWDASGAAVAYPLPDETLVTMSTANNVLLEFVVRFEE